MARYRQNLPQLTSERPFLTEAGIETTLIYEEKIALPYFATIVLLDTPEGVDIIRKCYKTYVEVAQKSSTGIVLETRTWRGARPWAEKLGITTEHLLQLNQKATALLFDIRNVAETGSTPIVISGTLGPLSDAYKESRETTLIYAREQYYDQVKTLVDSGVDLISIMTMTKMEEIKAAIELAQEFNVPIHVSFSIERDGMLLNRHSLEDTIKEIDAATGSYPVYYGINCAHPAHIIPLLPTMSDSVRKRIGSIRGNASLSSHEELDNSNVLDRGNIELFAKSFAEVSRLLPGLKVFGGCCGTDSEHLQATARVIIS